MEQLTLDIAGITNETIDRQTDRQTDTTVKRKNKAIYTGAKTCGGYE